MGASHTSGAKRNRQGAELPACRFSLQRSIRRHIAMSSHDRKNNQHKEPEPRHCQEQKRKLKNSQPAKKPRTTTKRSRLKDDIQPYDSGALVAEMTALMNLVK